MWVCASAVELFELRGLGVCVWVCVGGGGGGGVGARGSHVQEIGKYLFRAIALYLHNVTLAVYANQSSITV